jgi:hypothetical protein
MASPPIPDIVISDCDTAVYVRGDLARDRAVAVGVQELEERRSECTVRRVWMTELRGETAREASGGESDEYYLESERDSDGAFPMWKVTWESGSRRR